jgi:hypothetical protein
LAESYLSQLGLACERREYTRRDGGAAFGARAADLDAGAEIRLFGKLKLAICARPELRAGFLFGRYDRIA